MVTKKSVYFRVKGIGSRSWHWVRKSKKKATPLRRMWAKKAVEQSKSTALVPVRPAPMVAVKGQLAHLSGVKVIAMNHRMAG